MNPETPSPAEAAADTDAAAPTDHPTGPHGFDVTPALHHLSSEVIDPTTPDTGPVLHRDRTAGDDPAHPEPEPERLHTGSAWYPAD